MGAKDYTHASLTGLLHDNVVRECLANHREKAPMLGIIGWSPESRQTCYAQVLDMINAAIHRSKRDGEGFFGRECLFIST
jgi:hypothetical protein